MPTKIFAFTGDSIDGAAQHIITRFLEGTDKGGDVIYFFGWFGWGASAVLKAVVKRLRSSSAGWADSDSGRTTGAFEKIIHINFSGWQGKRGLQKAIAQELELPPQVMAIFDQYDEEDDFDGVEQRARGVIPEVKLAIMSELSARRFLVVFHNTSGYYIDLWEVGVPVIGKLNKKVLWASGGRFWNHSTERHDDEMDEEKLANKLSDVAIGVIPPEIEETIVKGMSKILHAEAEEVAKCTGIPEPDMSPKIVMECILFMALHDGTDQSINWQSHASNYWVCDGIIQDAIDGGRSAWEISDALQRNVGMDICTECAQATLQTIIMNMNDEDEHLLSRSDRWVSTALLNSRRVCVPSHATSFFWTMARPSSDHSRTRVLEASMFENSDTCSSLRVMHLSHCTFSFSSPPFLHCSNLRFLLLYHCKDKDAQDHSHSRQDGIACFQNLWVLELSYTDWNWLLSEHMLDQMVNLRELNVKGVSNRSMDHLHRCSGATSKVCKLQVVDESNNKDDGDGASSGKTRQVSRTLVASSFPNLSSWYILKTIMLDGCGDLEKIGHNALPLSLESFTIISNVTSKIKSLSFRGCPKLKSVLLRGLFDSLVEIDMSGTTIKTLDLSATQATGLRKLFLLGCEDLRAILWPDKKMKMDVLRIDTTTAATRVPCERIEAKSHKQDASASDDMMSIGSMSGTVCGNVRAVDSYISLRDPRLFRSLVDIRHVKGLHVEITSASDHKCTTPIQGTSSSGGGSNKQQVQQSINPKKPSSNLYIDDIIPSFNSRKSQAGGAMRDLFEASIDTMSMWHCPPIPEDSDCVHCYISIQDETQMTKLHLQAGTSSTMATKQETMATNFPPFVHEGAKTLHLHDSIFVTCLPGPAPSTATQLGWYELRWCRLERCSNLEGIVFTPPTSKDSDKDIFQHLETFWASQLMKARYIWDWSGLEFFSPGSHSFEYLTFLHLDYCPRLVHVLPLDPSNTSGCHRLEILEIVCCNNLREVFSSDGHLESQSLEQQRPREFPSLERIHLFELPKLQRICGRRMLAPNLETVKIRGCWSLKRLPSVVAGYRHGRRLAHTRRPPSVDCEKGWWEGLEWDGEASGHHPTHYKRTHSAYWNKTRLRTSLLR